MKYKDNEKQGVMEPVIYETSLINFKKAKQDSIQKHPISINSLPDVFYKFTNILFCTFCKILVEQWDGTNTIEELL